MKSVNLDAVFSADGTLAAQLPGYAPRAAQRELAEAVLDAIQSRRLLIAEAGTGTGKTLAYLTPALLSDQRVVISTGTKNLQEQLFQHDLPLLRRCLPVPFQAALLKGRANYLCPHRLKLAAESGRHANRYERADYEQIRAWAIRTQSGDISEVSAVAENASIWPAVTSTTDNCLGQDCPELENCFLLKARRRAQEAQVVVINHHLLCAEWRLRDGGFGELLSDVAVVIVDEAHQLADTASQFLGIRISGRRLLELSHDSRLEFAEYSDDGGLLDAAAQGLEHATRELRQVLGGQTRRGAWDELSQSAPTMIALADLAGALDELGACLRIAAERSKGLASCWERCRMLQDQLNSVRHDDHSDWVRWFETAPKSFALHRTPLDIAAPFRQFMQRFSPVWVFTSATLAVAQRFEHFQNGLGLSDAATRCWDSPFDYPNQALLYQPDGLPEPSTAGYTQAVVVAAMPVLKASKGRAFFLFTSHQAMQEAATLLQGKLPYPLYVQGSQPKSALLERFKRDGNAVLLATASFWEGVDVRGDALSCVIIDKLPFASPGDPVLKARLDALRRRGVEPFTALQLPQAVIALKQGVGRLIRDVQDRGVLVLCDPRLSSKPYGRVFLNSLPAMPTTRRLAQVQAFFKKPPRSKNFE